VRVISGTARGTRLRSLSVPSLRPMLDRVKEALFNIIRDEIEGARVLDLFGGSGALGIEALSRGAESCVFVEKDRRLAHLMANNIERCHLSEKAIVLRADFFELASCRALPAGLPATLVFADPSYEIADDPNRRTELFEAMEDLVGAWIARGALLTLHHYPMPHAVWPTKVLENFDQRIYGRSQLTFFRVGGEKKF